MKSTKFTIQNRTIGDTLIVRNIARSDGTVTTATPTIVVNDEPTILVLYIPKGTRYQNNYVISPEERAAAVDTMIPSAQRQYREKVSQNNSLRLYVPGYSYSIGLTFADDGRFMSWYGNLEAPYVVTPIGIDTRDYALDVVAYPDGRWQWKDEEEFVRRLAMGVDSPEHQARARAAGEDFVRRFEENEWPFNAGWPEWAVPTDWLPRGLPEKWYADFDTHAVLSNPKR